MITDALLQLSAAQAVTATAVSTNSIDLGTNRDIGAGEDLYAVFNVDASVAAAGNAFVSFSVISSASANLAAPTVLASSGAIPKADLVAGRAPISIPIPQSVLTSLPIGQRYLGVRYTVTTGPLTAGSFTANITDSEVSVGKNYPSGFAVA